MSLQENLAFDALADRVRRQVLSALSEGGELTVTEIADRVDSVGRSTISSHLKVLRLSGLVVERRDGRHRRYNLDAEGSVRTALVYLQDLLTAGVSEIGTPTHRSGVRHSEEAG